MTEVVTELCAVALFGSLFGLLIPKHRTEKAVRFVLGAVLLLSAVAAVSGLSAELPRFSWQETETVWRDGTEYAVSLAVCEEMDRVLSERFGCRVTRAEVTLHREGETLSLGQIRLFCTEEDPEITAYARAYLQTEAVTCVGPS